MNASSSRLPALLGVAVLSAALGAGAVHLFGRHEAPLPEAAPKAAAPERKILYWHDPMKPEVHFDKPGKSPFMDMQLVPVYADDAPAGTGVRIDPRVAQNINVRLAEVERVREAPQLTAPGTVRFDETRSVALQARVGGYIERQSVRATGQAVSRGQVLAEITAPELVQAQEELLLATRLKDAALIEAAKSRLSLLGMSGAQAAQVATSGRVQRSVAVVAPAGGVVTEIAARPGMNVAAGAPLFSIAALDAVWVVADLPERDAARLAAGGAAEVSFAALPGEVFKGKVEFVYPTVAADTRSAQLRVALPNPQGRLRPGMLASVRFSDGMPREFLAVPAEAVIETGTRSVVILAQEGGRYAVADVRTGGERGGRTEILSGLGAGQKVVASGQFLIDSEASLKGALARLGAAAPAKTEDAAPAAVHEHAAPASAPSATTAPAADPHAGHPH